MLTHDRLDDLVPIEPAAMEDRQVIEWDKDDIDALQVHEGRCARPRACSAACGGPSTSREHKGDASRSRVHPGRGSATYAMIRKADTLGTFQIESRAQMSMLPRMKPATFYDLVIEVAIVRPGPIQGDMVHPYLRRREGLEPVTIRRRS